jgi:hypothetical protein
LTIFFKYDLFDTSYIFQLIDAVVDSFNTIVAKDGIVLNFGGLDGPDTLPIYLEKWRMQLWDLCGNTDSNFFCSRPQISTKTGSLKFGNK